MSPGLECECAWSEEQGGGCGLACRVHRKQGCPWWASVEEVTAWTSQTGQGCEQSGQEPKCGVPVWIRVGDLERPPAAVGTSFMGATEGM